MKPTNKCNWQTKTCNKQTKKHKSSRHVAINTTQLFWHVRASRMVLKWWSKSMVCIAIGSISISLIWAFVVSGPRLQWRKLPERGQESPQTLPPAFLFWIDLHHCYHHHHNLHHTRHHHHHHNAHQRRKRVDQLLCLKPGLVWKRKDGEREMLRLETGGAFTWKSRGAKLVWFD